MKEVKYIQKRGKNAFHNYNYATEADVAEKVREILAEQNVMLFPSLVGQSIREVTTRKGHIEYIANVEMEFTFVDGDTGETFTIKMAGEGQDAGDKGIYKAITGAQKYALMKTFMIPTGDDPENEEGERDTSKPEPVKNQQLANRPTPPTPTAGKISCVDCGSEINQAVVTFSTKKFGKAICRDCQAKVKGA